ncbi:DUF4079 domain-containing protein [Microcoleus sp. FACHB-1515]|uniref:DUF4079 domain-containing protein n=1 Tax=Cyanophyceae TaxID=3028117 RepID=UPI0016863CD3|nr:DUF4079 family protein [Microcoleus sp. FACHB-1515]MBD2090616.1 DUF4079 domain-containing protein [Microcoleus sp. FACHB-1515]
MDLPSFIWLWRIAAWAMGLAILAYLLLAVSGVWLSVSRLQWPSGANRLSQANWVVRPSWLRWTHIGLGSSLVVLVLLLLAIGIVGTIGHYGSLGHSPHLAAGIDATLLTAASAWSAFCISPLRPWARPLHWLTGLLLLVGFVRVSLTGWDVVQKYLP